jgi:hypothetical protein
MMAVSNAPIYLWMEPKNTWLDPNLGGHANLDRGCILDRVHYSVFRFSGLARFVFGICVASLSFVVDPNNSRLGTFDGFSIQKWQEKA